MNENKEFITQSEENGVIHISQDVIATIAAVAASEVEGVAALATQNAEFSERFTKKSIAKGIRLCLSDNDEVCIECCVIAQFGNSVVELAKNVQESIYSAIESMTALKIASVDVNVCGIAMKK